MDVPKQSLIGLVRGKDFYNLLSVLKDKTKFTPQELNTALHEATWHGEKQMVLALLDAHADMYSLNSHAEPLLLEAVNSGSLDIVQLLIQRGYSINWQLSDASDTSVPLPLHLAIQKGYLDIAKELINVGINLEFKDQDGDTPLISAVMNRLPELVLQMLQRKCKVNEPGHQNNTALHRASERDNLNNIHCLVENGAFLDIQNDNGNTPFLVACEAGILNNVQYFLQAGIDVTVQNKEQKNALHLAALDGHDHLVDILIACGVQNDCQDIYGNTPLLTSLSEGQNQRKFVSNILKHGIDVNKTGALGKSALHWTCVHGLDDLINELLERDAKVDVKDEEHNTALLLASKHKPACLPLLLKDSECIVNDIGGEGKTVAHWIAKFGDKDVMSILIDKGADLSIEDSNGNTPLLMAAFHKQYSMMRYLLKHTVNMNAKGENGRTALHYVCLAGYTDMVRQLLQKSCDPNAKDGFGDSPLTLAAHQKHAHSIQELLNYGANVNHIGQLGRSALHWCAIEGMLDSVELLLKDANIELNALDEVSENSPLQLAASSGNEAIIKMLVVKGAQVNVKGKDGCTPLNHAANQGLVESVKVLLEAGALPDNDTAKSSPLIQSCKKGFEEIAKMLVLKGADLSRTDDLERSALHWAAQNGHHSIAQNLIDNGANPKLIESSGDTPLTLSSWGGHADLVELLAPLSDLDHKENEDGFSSLFLAISKNHEQVVELLLGHGAKINITDSNGNNALILAATYTIGTGILEMILKCGQDIDLDSTGNMGRTALHWAVGEPDSVKLFVLRSMDLNKLDINGASPLLLSIAHGKPESAKILVEAGCDIHLLHPDWRAPIHHAAMYGELEVMQLLVEKGIEPEAPTKDGKTPLLIAATEGRLCIVDYLIEKNCELNAVYFDAITALSMASRNRHFIIVKSLLEAGADPNLIGEQKNPPLVNCAFVNDVRGTVQLLQGNARISGTFDHHPRPLQVAIIKSNVFCIYVLASVECDINFLRGLTKGGAIFYFITNSEVTDFLMDISVSPRPLSLLARQTIRECIGVPLQPTLQKLKMPQVIKDFISMKELDQLIM